LISSVALIADSTNIHVDTLAQLDFSRRYAERTSANNTFSPGTNRSFTMAGFGPDRGEPD
jgi:hypothetical protein